MNTVLNVFKNSNLTLIEENPVKLKNDHIEDIDDFDNIFQNAYIWQNDGHR